MPNVAPGKEEPLAGVRAEDRGVWGSSSAGKALEVLADSSSLATKLAKQHLGLYCEACSQ